MDWIRSHKRQAIFIVIVLAVIFCIGIAVAVMLGIKGGSEELSGKAPEKTAVSAENEPVDSGTAIYSSAGTTQQTDASGAESTSQILKQKRVKPGSLAPVRKQRRLPKRPNIPPIRIQLQTRAVHLILPAT